MSDMHALGSDRNGYRVVMHFDVPAGDNAVGTSWTDAILAVKGKDDLGNTALPKTVLQDGDGIVAGTISAAEKAEIEAGTRHEFVDSFPIESGGTSNADLRASLREFYASEKARLTDNLQTQLKYVGHTESEA